MQHKFTIT